ncbi:ATP-dependent DNA helicase pif1 [Fusarium oxysporum f. sp. albedinis]|nr:ATP-dependent DNA helicase pif1 [Fusarium oxysporum f. sp. albedinis]
MRDLLVTENELLEPEQDSFLDNEEIEENGDFTCDNFTISSLDVGDSTISTIKTDLYYEEEIVNLPSAEEGEDQRQPQISQTYAE